MANWDIRLGYKNLAWFNANPNLILKSGQHVYLSDTANRGQFKMGDGVTKLSLLTFYPVFALPGGVAGDVQMNNGLSGFAASGLNYTLATNTFIYTTAQIWKPSANNAAGLNFTKADGTTSILNIDSTNGRVGIGATALTAKLTIYNTGSDTTPLKIWTNGSQFNYTALNGGIFLYSAANEEMLRIWAGDPDFGYYINTGCLFIGKYAGLNQVTDVTATSGLNTGIGARVLYSNTTGEKNTGVGTDVLLLNVTGNNNAGFGTFVLQNNLASNNSAFGSGSLNTNTSGTNNSAFGFYSLVLNSSGNTNSAYGANSLYNNSTGSGNIAIGYYAGAYETGSNHLYIDNQNRTNTAGDKAKAIIYGEMAAAAVNQVLHINAIVMPISTTTVGAPAYQEGAIYYDTTLHKLRFGGAAAWETISTGTAAHDILSATHSDTLADTVARGDIFVGNSTPKWSRKAKGAAGVLVTFDANDVIYTTATYPATVALGSVLVANALNTITALTETVGTKYLKNAAGVISWDTVSGGAPGGASGDLQMNDGSGGFAYGGLNYTAAGVLMKYTKDMVFYPTADSTTAFLFSNAARNDGVYYDSTNNRFVGKGGTTAILQVSHSAGISLLYGSLGLMAGGTSATLAYSSVVGVWVFNDRIEFKDANGTGVTARLSYKGLSLGAWTAFDASAHLHIAGCTTAAGSAPIKIDSGTLMTNPENGAIESDGTHVYWTDSGGNRKQLDN